MTQPTHISRPITIRARRDTVALVASAVAATFALSYAIHPRPDHADRLSVHEQEVAAKASPQQDWTGALAGMTPTDATTSDPITSASLVVPKSDLALPATPVRPLVKLRGCEDLNCVAKAGTPIQRRVTTLAETNRMPHRPISRDRGSLMSSLNPLNHLPDISIIHRPIAYAGNTFTNWFRRN